MYRWAGIQLEGFRWRRVGRAVVVGLWKRDRFGRWAAHDDALTRNCGSHKLLGMMDSAVWGWMFLRGSPMPSSNSHCWQSASGMGPLWGMLNQKGLPTTWRVIVASFLTIHAAARVHTHKDSTPDSSVLTPESLTSHKKRRIVYNSTVFSSLSWTLSWSGLFSRVVLENLITDS